MAENAVEAALNRAAQEQKDQNQRDIADARATLSHLEMKDMNTIGPPPAPIGAANPNGLDKLQINPETQANIENISSGPGNNYLKENEMDKAVSRQSQEQDMQRAGQEERSR